MSDARALRPDEVLGRRLVEIVQTDKLDEPDTTDSVCDFVFSFYRLDSGVSFTLPMRDADGIAAETPPPDAQPTEHSLLGHVYGQSIVAVHRPEPDSDLVYYDSLFLELENGYIVTDIMGSPKGIADEGVWIFAPGEIARADLVPLWVME